MTTFTPPLVAISWPNWTERTSTGRQSLALETTRQSRHTPGPGTGDLPVQNHPSNWHRLTFFTGPMNGTYSITSSSGPPGMRCFSWLEHVYFMLKGIFEPNQNAANHQTDECVYTTLRIYSPSKAKFMSFKEKSTVSLSSHNGTTVLPLPITRSLFIEEQLDENLYTNNKRRQRHRPTESTQRGQEIWTFRPTTRTTWHYCPQGPELTTRSVCE